MIPNKSFRSAIHGFNREDVVHYIELLNNQHTEQLEQLKNQLQSAEERIHELEQCLAQTPVVPVPKEPVPAADDELEIYRRAERTERQAKERAQQICNQANGILADITLKAEDVSAQIGALADQLAEQLQRYREAVLATKDTFQESTDALSAIKPEV